MSKPTSTEPLAWHLYIRSASNFTVAQDRMQEAADAGVDFAAMSRFQ